MQASRQSSAYSVIFFYTASFSVCMHRETDYQSQLNGSIEQHWKSHHHLVKSANINRLFLRPCFTFAFTFFPTYQISVSVLS